MERYFTKLKDPSQSVFDMFTWKRVSVKIQDYATGNVLFAADDLEFPEGYSQTACDIIAKMYFRKAGVQTNGLGYENSMRMLASRMADFWIAAALDENIITADDAEVLWDEIVYMLLAQIWAPNSPQWFNTGLKMAYGITGDPGGISYYDPEKEKIVYCKDAYTRTQASACFIVGINDSLLGKQSLMDNLSTASRLFKYGSGIGSNWSNIRGAGEKLSGGGQSSGLLSFQKVFDRNAGAIKSGGTTRRAAVMEVLDVNHPEIFEFVQWKAREEDKVVALGKMGYDTSIAGDAYETVSGQNVNNSVSIPDSFMRKVSSPTSAPEDPDPKWELTARTDGHVMKETSAENLWNEIAWAAWRCGDPGVQFSDTINRWHTCLNDGRIVASNPCSEYLFLNDTACNLASINVMKFFDPEVKDLSEAFDIQGFRMAVQYITYILEASIHWGAFPTTEIAKNTHLYRTVGLGLTNMGALVMAMGLPYDSKDARNYLAYLCSEMTAWVYHTSAKMARDVGSFPRYDANKSQMTAVMHQHTAAVERVLSEISSNLITDEQKHVISEVWHSNCTSAVDVGFRNAQATVLAPTGTIAFAMDCASTSSEPFFAHTVYKKVVDGSSIQIVNQIIPVALTRLGYAPEEIQAIEDYIMNGDGKIEGAPYLKEEHLPIFDTANRCGSGSRYLTPIAHVRMVAALQPHISGGISKTVNMPSDATVDDIKEIYYNAWRLGCKCIALYRDGCKVVQPLMTHIDDCGDCDSWDKLSYWDLLKYAKEAAAKISHYEGHMDAPPANMKNVNVRPEATNEMDDTNVDRLIREKLPYEPKCIKNAVKMDGTTYHIQRSFYDDGRIGEIFVSVGKQGNTIKGLTEVLCILISKCLQYGIPVEVISDILRNTEFQPNGIVRQHPYIKSAASIPDLISKFLDISSGDYRFCQIKPEDTMIDKESGRSAVVMPKKNPPDIKGERVYDHVCPACGSTHIIKAGTCHYCQNCGASSGCS